MGPIFEVEDRPMVLATDRFGTLTLEVGRPFLLCVPSSKTLLP
jgi:hypothetical protein